MVSITMGCKERTRGEVSASVIHDGPGNQREGGMEEKTAGDDGGGQAEVPTGTGGTN